MALTSCRTLAETLLEKAVEAENLTNTVPNTFQERITYFHREGIITNEQNEAFYVIRKYGNAAAHDSFRKFYIREALEVWENTYKVVKWFIEVYGSTEIQVPEYDEPAVKATDHEDLSKVLEIIKSLEERLQGGEISSNEGLSDEGLSKAHQVSRVIKCDNEQLEIPFFLRDAFLLPQRFPKSTTFLIRLNGEQQARIMSELPENFEGLHQHVKRFNEKNDATFFEELKEYVKEETIRKKIEEQHPGEMILFYKEDYIILTEALGEVELTIQDFPGSPSFIKQLHEQNITKVNQLPKELVLLGKYKNVGETTLQRLFEQLKLKALEISKEYVTI
ncbi:DUF4145 domain-containing protein [Lysinibacillus telephonicus]|uniref:DUF4145 domain-containing protein n=2 Tax=Lysinibacillus telephonicus TaxID=1714840 RepID=A0A3S0J261_9BACI|nr:DUF4145 domain-containing protein [Lysinibacillus telephonicus]